MHPVTLEYIALPTCSPQVFPNGWAFPYFGNQMLYLQSCAGDILA